MGVSGSGKSTVGALLASRLGAVFLDADDLHSEEARVKMTGGAALTDADRAPWLRRVADRIAATAGGGQRIVVACSALRRAYRDILRGSGVPVSFVHLDGAEGLLGARLAQRIGHFMPPALLESQLETLEPLAADEAGVRVTVEGPPERVASDALAALGLAPPPLH